MLATLRSALRESAALGYATTRLIGDMEWAADDAATDRELVAYESEVDPLTRGTRATVVCVYDLGHHRAGRIAAVMASHRAVFVDGRLLRADGPSPAPTARDRMLTAASTLFADKGVRATGVDALIASAGVAKATFYRHFPSKDDLIVAWLRDPRTRWFDRVRAQVEAMSVSGDEVITNLFTTVAARLERDDFRGFPYLNTAIELNDPGHPATATIRSYLREVETYFQDTVAAAGHDDAAALGSALQALLVGSIALAAAHRDSSFVLIARDAAVRLLGSGQA
jgi:AcrR family transcriptional regulator